jgi:septal ring factor EnvC (AmiA/AmiB activator)
VSSVEPTPPISEARDSASARPWRRRLLWGGGVLAAIALLAVAGAASYLAYSNNERADRWRARAGKLERNADTLNALLVKRTRTLNARVRQLNVMAAEVRRARLSLTRSEGDVKTLEQRQRELANEKAQLEDQRGALIEQQSSLEQVASAYSTCKGELEDVLSAFADNDYGWLDANIPTVAADCAYADSSFDDYLAAYR